MKVLSITNFKTNALKIINQIANTRESIVITKHGKPLVEVTPYTQKADHPVPGKLKHLYKGETDIISPFGEDIWNAAV